MDGKRPISRPTTAVGIGLLVIPLATICALSLIPERSAFAVGVPMARQLVLFLEERTRRVEASGGELGNSQPDTDVPTGEATLVASLPGRAPSLKVPHTTPLRHAAADSPPPAGRERQAPPLLRGPPC